jgi:hypothetical protein
MSETAVAKPPETAVIPKQQIGTGAVVSIIPQTFDEVFRMATLIVKSGIGPKGLATPEAAAVAIMAGAEVGVPPMASVQNIAVINGRPCMWGDLIVALVQASGKLEYLVETWDEKTQTATTQIKRVGKPEMVSVFSMADAKRAKLADKDLYKNYPQRMIGWRSKTYAIRSEFSDVLKGLSIREEVEDYIDVEATEAKPLPPMPREIGAQPEAEPEQDQGEPPADDAPPERTIEDEIRETGEVLGKKPVEVEALIREHTKKKTLDSLRDEFRRQYKARQVEG